MGRIILQLPGDGCHKWIGQSTICMPSCFIHTDFSEFEITLKIKLLWKFSATMSRRDVRFFFYLSYITFIHSTFMFLGNLRVSSSWMYNLIKLSIAA